jgi:hypothetical protein
MTVPLSPSIDATSLSVTIMLRDRHLMLDAASNRILRYSSNDEEAIKAIPETVD